MIELLLPEPVLLSAQQEIDKYFVGHRLWEALDQEKFITETCNNVQGIARGRHFVISKELIDRLPKLEIIACFGVGYDGIDLRRCQERDIVVTNTPDVLTEETADAALGLLLMTVRELSSAERYLRAGKWLTDGNYPRTEATLRDRTVGLVGFGRIGQALARRITALNVPVVYHSRNPKKDVSFPYYSNLLKMARDVDTLVVVLPATEFTRRIISERVLEALGERGIFINIGRGAVVDEAALIRALIQKTIFAAGLDVYVNEPNVPRELLELNNVVLLPHVGSASQYTHNAMGALLLKNLHSWFQQGVPITPVVETSWITKSRGGSAA